MATPNRWTPWIESAFNLAGDVTITLTTPTTILTAPATITPHVDTRMLVFLNFDIILTAAPGSDLFLEVAVSPANGSPRRMAANPNVVNGRDHGSHVFMMDLTKEVTYTVSLSAYLSAAGSTFVVKGAPGITRGTGITLVALPNLQA